MEYLAAGVLFDKSILVTTRYSQVTENANTCIDGDTYCPNLYNYDGEEETYYVADIGSFTILIDHYLEASVLGVSATSGDLNGVLYVDSNDNLCATDETARKSAVGTEELTNCKQDLVGFLSYC
jgi:hypothetical protein